MRYTRHITSRNTKRTRVRSINKKKRRGDESHPFSPKIKKPKEEREREKKKRYYVNTPHGGASTKQTIKGGYFIPISSVQKKCLLQIKIYHTALGTLYLLSANNNLIISILRRIYIKRFPYCLFFGGIIFIVVVRNKKKKGEIELIYFTRINGWNSKRAASIIIKKKNEGKQKSGECLRAAGGQTL